jgi:hypothetical protein
MIKKSKTKVQFERQQSLKKRSMSRKERQPQEEQGTQKDALHERLKKTK